MNEKYIINDRVAYHPEQHLLMPLGGRGKETPLNIPASRCLLLMLQRPDTNISQETFFSEVWEKQGQYVTPNTFYQNVSLLRRALRNAGLKNPVIRTVPRIGLRFTGVVQVVKALPATQIIQEEDLMHQMAQQPEEKAQVTEGTVDLPEEKAMVTEDTVTIPEKTVTSVSEVILDGIEDITATKGPVKTRYNRAFSPPSSGIIITLSALVFVLLSVITYRYIIFPTLTIPQSAGFFGEHMHFFTVNGCDVFINRLEKEVNRERFTLFVEEKKVFCNTNEFLYITNSPLTIKKMIMRCQASADSHLECRTLYAFV